MRADAHRRSHSFCRLKSGYHRRSLVSFAWISTILYTPCTCIAWDVCFITPAHYPLSSLLLHPCYSAFRVPSLRLVPLGVARLAASFPFSDHSRRLSPSIFIHLFFIHLSFYLPFKCRSMTHWVSDLPTPSQIRDVLDSNVQKSAKRNQSSTSMSKNK